MIYLATGMRNTLGLDSQNTNIFVYIFPYRSEFLVETPVINDKLAREKQTNLLTCAPHAYIGDTQKKISNSPRLAQNSDLITILLKKRGMQASQKKCN